MFQRWNWHWAVLANNYADACVKQYEGAGFVPASSLTDEQRALIVPVASGLVGGGLPIKKTRRHRTEMDRHR
jgi:hypothetical protein